MFSKVAGSVADHVGLIGEKIILLLEKYFHEVTEEAMAYIIEDFRLA